MYHLWLSFPFLLAWFSCVSVFWGNYMCTSCIQMRGSLSQLIQKALRTSGSGGGKGIVYFNMCVRDVDRRATQKSRRSGRCVSPSNVHHSEMMGMITAQEWRSFLIFVHNCSHLGVHLQDVIWGSLPRGVLNMGFQPHYAEERAGVWRCDGITLFL